MANYNLPPGFILEREDSPVNLPPGFELDEPETQARGGFVENFGRAIVASALGVGKAAVGLHETLLKVAYPEFWPESKRQALEATGRWLENIRRTESKFTKTGTGGAAWAGYVIGEAIPYMGSALAGGIIAGPVGAGMVGFAVEGQEAYEGALAGGATEGQAQAERVVVGSMNAAIEALQITRLMKFQKAGKGGVRAFVQAARRKAFREMAKAGTNLTKDILKIAIEEAIEEFVQE
ncbi:MAG: hypothetical protein ACYTEO_18145, partial [Planctomycetota bacterium]